MPILAAASGRKGTKDDSFLPSIHAAAGHAGAADGKVASPRKAKGADESALRDHALPSTRVFTDGKKLYSSAPASESSTPFKLPNIHHRKSNSVTNLASDQSGPRASRERFPDRRAQITRSPSCPSVLEQRVHDNLSITPRTSRANLSVRNASVLNPPALASFDSNGDLKLPDIFKHRDKDKGASVVAGNAPRTKPRAGTSGDQHEHPIPDSNRKPEVQDHHRSGTQVSALLLPISPRSQKSVNTTGKSKRKRKKRYGVTPGGDGLVSETLLKEKLMAIERRYRNEQASVQEVEEEMVNGQAREQKDTINALSNSQ